MDRSGALRQTQRGSVRFALLCALAGAAAVFAWNARQFLDPAEPPAASPAQTDPLSPGATPATDARGQSAAGRAAAAPATPGRAAAAGLPGVDAPDGRLLPPTDADGFSPDYGALVDDFQQQRALDPLVDE